MTKSKQKIKLDGFPLESSLGMLANGDIAFALWREAKKKKNKKSNEKK